MPIPSHFHTFVTLCTLTEFVHVSLRLQFMSLSSTAHSPISTKSANFWQVPTPVSFAIQNWNCLAAVLWFQFRQSWPWIENSKIPKTKAFPSLISYMNLTWSKMISHVVTGTVFQEVKTREGPWRLREALLHLLKLVQVFQYCPMCVLLVGFGGFFNFFVGL